MFCSNCGIKLNDGDAFCGSCGSEVVDYDAPVVHQPQHQQPLVVPQTQQPPPLAQQPTELLLGQQPAFQPLVEQQPQHAYQPQQTYQPPVQQPLPPPVQQPPQAKPKSKVAVICIIAAVAVLVVSLALFLGTDIFGGANRPLTAAEHLDLGERFLLDFNYEQALVHFLAVIDIEPMNPRGYTGAAEAHVGLGQYDDAIAVLLQGIEELPGNASIITMRNLLDPGLEIAPDADPAPELDFDVEPMPEEPAPEEPAPEEPVAEEPEILVLTTPSELNNAINYSGDWIRINVQIPQQNPIIFERNRGCQLWTMQYTDGLTRIILPTFTYQDGAVRLWHNFPQSTFAFAQNGEGLYENNRSRTFTWHFETSSTFSLYRNSGVNLTTDLGNIHNQYELITIYVNWPEGDQTIFSRNSAGNWYVRSRFGWISHTVATLSSNDADHLHIIFTREGRQDYHFYGDGTGTFRSAPNARLANFNWHYSYSSLG